MAEDPPQGPEVLPPDNTERETTGGDSLNILALISTYTDRPDLFVAEIEKHDPGFVKRLNASAEAHSQQLRDGKFRFGERQAYTSLAIRVFGAVVLLGVFAYTFVSGQEEFWTTIAIVIFFAVSQGGTRGFSKIIEAFARAITQLRKDGN